jgi:hypothetical protein
MVGMTEHNIEMDIIYKGEQYCIRDNGAVFRFPKNSKKLRPTDNKWTFGKLNYKTGYLEIASAPVHRIVATAYLGEPPTKEHVVDHIDTNKQNNRPENLRWVTRLENILFNPITAKRIEIVCGSVEEFLADPSKFRDRFQEPNYKWMCAVSIQDAQVSKKRLLAWAQREKPLQGGKLGEWIFNRGLTKEKNENEIELINSLTPNAVQKAQNWKTPAHFPCCPNEENNTSITAYLANLKPGGIFSKNQYSSSIIEKFAYNKVNTSILVMSRSSDNNATKPYSLAEITLVNNHFIHSNLGSFFQKEGAEKQFIVTQGLEWTGSEPFDELC